MNEVIIIGLIFVTMFVIVVGAGFAFAGGDPAKDRAVKRAQAMTSAAQRDARRGARAAASNSPEARRKQIMKSLQDQERQQKKVRLTLTNKLYQAGLGITVTQFWIAGGVFGFAIAAFAFIAHVNPLVALALGASCAFGVPQWVLGFLATRARTSSPRSFQTPWTSSSAASSPASRCTTA
ncbi:MAG: hypothetical protein WDM85_16625 [Caulobacteraceae bacterium]